MTDNSMRAELSLNLVCAGCGDKMTASKDSSNIGCDSFYECHVNFAIEPCARCYKEARRPAELIREALDKIQHE